MFRAFSGIRGFIKRLTIDMFIPGSEQKPIIHSALLGLRSCTSWVSSTKWLKTIQTRKLPLLPVLRSGTQRRLFI